MDALTVAEPHLVVSYNRHDITADMSPFLLSVGWTADLEGKEADSLDITLEDTDGLWLNGLYPRKGDTLELQIGYRGEGLVPCGAFEIDEIEVEGPPSQVKVKALGAAVMKTLRTHKGHAYEDTTLAGIVRAVAERHRLQVVGEVEDIPVRRVTQAHEQDLKFLRRLATEYGYAFNVRGDKLTFVPLDGLRAKDAVRVLGPADMAHYNFRDKIKGTPAQASVAYHDPSSKETVSYAMNSEGEVVPSTSADTLKHAMRAESPRQAQAKAQAALRGAQDQATVCTCTLWGDPTLVAGVNVELEGWGQLSGRYQIARSMHRIGRGSGYTTELELRRVQAGKAATAAARTGKRRLLVATLDENEEVVLR